MAKCVQCGFDNPKKAIFCVGCGSVVDSSQFSDKELVQESETKIKGFLESIREQTTIGVTQINEAISHLESVTQENVEIANSSAEISERVDRVAKDILDDVNKKKF